MGIQASKEPPAQATQQSAPVVTDDNIVKDETPMEDVQKADEIQLNTPAPLQTAYDPSHQVARTPTTGVPVAVPRPPKRQAEPLEGPVEVTVQEPDDQNRALPQLPDPLATEQTTKSIDVITINDSENKSDMAGEANAEPAETQLEMALEVSQLLRRKPSQPYSVAPLAGCRVDLHGKSPNPRPVKKPRTE